MRNVGTIAEDGAVPSRASVAPYSGETAPTSPYLGQEWIQPSTGLLAIYVAASSGFTWLVTGYGAAGMALAAPGGTVVLTTDVANSTLTIADVTGLSFPVIAGRIYRFRFVIPYTSAAATTGSRWSISGPASPTMLAYSSRYTLTATTETVNYPAAYDVPAAANASSLTAGNLAIIDGVIQPSAAGSVIARFASEVAASAITAKIGAFVNYEAIK